MAANSQLWTPEAVVLPFSGGTAAAACRGAVFIFDAVGLSFYAGIFDQTQGLSWRLAGADLDQSTNVAGMVSYRDLLFVVGGAVSGAATDSILVYQVGTDYSVTLKSIQKLPAASGTAGAVVVGDYLVVVGVNTGLASASASTYMAKIDPDGQLGPFIQQADMPAAVRVFSMATYGKHVYVLGGANGGGVLQSAIYRATVNSDTLTPWTKVGDMLAGRRNQASIVFGQDLITMGGTTAAGTTAPLTSVEVAHLNADGSLGLQEFMADTAVPVKTSGVARVGNYIFLLGGQTGNPVAANTNVVQHLKVR